MAVPLRKRLRRAIRSALLRAAVRVLAALPLRPALALGAAIGRLAWVMAPAQRRLALEHLAVAFPEKSEAERRAIGRASLVHLGRMAMEVVTARRQADRLAEYVRFAPGSEELLRDVLARGKGVVYVTGHLGNWELMARRVGLVVPHAVIARRNADERLNELVERFRAEGGSRTLWREDPSTGRQIIKVFRSGGLLGILIDQDTRVQGVFVPFFGRLAFTPRAAADLALRFRAAVVVGATHRRGPHPGDGHEVELVELKYDADPADREAEVERLTAAAVAFQEAALRRHPEEWVWMHRRWKTRPPTECSLASGMPKSRELSGI